MEYVFLAAGNAHHRRSNYSSRIVRPAADGWYPGRNGRYGSPYMPVLVDASAPCIAAGSQPRLRPFPVFPVTMISKTG